QKVNSMRQSKSKVIGGFVENLTRAGILLCQRSRQNLCLRALNARRERMQEAPGMKAGVCSHLAIHRPTRTGGFYGATALVKPYMTKLHFSAACTVIDHTINHHTTAHSASKGDIENTAVSLACAKQCLAKGRDVCIVVDPCR